MALKTLRFLLAPLFLVAGCTAVNTDESLESESVEHVSQPSTTETTKDHEDSEPIQEPSPYASEAVDNESHELSGPQYGSLPMPIFELGEVMTLDSDAFGTFTVLELVLDDFTCGHAFAEYHTHNPLTDTSHVDEVEPPHGHQFCRADFQATNVGPEATDNMPWPVVAWVGENEAVRPNDEKDWVNLNVKMEAFDPGIDAPPGSSFEYTVWISLPEDAHPEAIGLSTSQFTQDEIAIVTVQ